MKKVILSAIMLAVCFSAAAESRVDKILKNGTIRVGTTGDYKPFTHIDDGEYKGYDIDIAKYIGKELGVEVVFIPTTWKTLLIDLENDKFDIAMGGISRNTGRKLKAEFSRPYLTYGKCPVVRKEDAKRYTSLGAINQPGVKVGVNIGGTNEKFADSMTKKATIVRYENNLDVPIALINGEVDVMISETPEGIYYENNYEELASPMTKNPMTKNQLGYLIPKGEYGMVALINFIMDDMELKGIMDEFKEEYSIKY